MSQTQEEGASPVVERVVNAANNRLVSDSSNPITYDANGNVTLMRVAGCSGAAALTYDYFNRLTRVAALHGLRVCGAWAAGVEKDEGGFGGGDGDGVCGT